MTRIVITIDVEDAETTENVRVQAGPNVVANTTRNAPITTGSKAAANPSVAADEPPPPAEPPPDLFAEAQRVFEQAPRCPQHGEMKRFPAGVSKKTGKPYSASWRCKPGCETKPVWEEAA